MSRRTERVNELLRSELSDILRSQVKDPRLDVLFSVTEVDTSPDLKHARVYVSVMSDDEQKTNVFRALQTATPFIRHELRGRLTSLRYTPDLMFLRDESIERGARLAALIDEVTADEREPSS